MRGAAFLLAAVLLGAAAGAAPVRPASPDSDPVLEAMQEELERARTLRLVSLDPPYYVEYSLHDGQGFAASATLGALIGSQRNRFRAPRLQVRAGDYKFDSTNYVYSDYPFGSGYDMGPFPLDNNKPAMRAFWWLATDRAYKSAIEVLARKRAALKNYTQTEELPDFAQVQPVRIVTGVKRSAVDEELWRARVRSLSAVFAEYPAIISSSVDFDAVESVFYYANSEGSVTRTMERLAYLRVRASAQAQDGAPLRNAYVFHARDYGRMPAEAELRRGVVQVAEELSALSRAPVGETYSGPMLFEPQAAAQLFAQLLGTDLRVPRRPVPEPGRPAPFVPSALEGRSGSRVLPEWMDVVDDPTQQEWRGRDLLGHYLADMEGLPPAPLSLIEKGVLKNFLLTRQPVRGLGSSNGRARLPGSFGAKTAVFGNLFVRASETVPAAGMRKKLIEMCRARNKPYGILVRKLDFPSSAQLDEMRRLAAGMGQGEGRPVSPPLLAYRVYPDGREELVRGLRFRGVATRSLRDIVAASDETEVFDFLENGALFALMGVGAYAAECSVVAPGVLFEDMQVERPSEDLPKLPLVPPPPLGAGR